MTIEVEGTEHPETAAESPAEAAVTAPLEGKNKSLDEIVAGLGSTDELKPIDGVPITEEAKTAGKEDSPAKQKKGGEKEDAEDEEEDDSEEEEVQEAMVQIEMVPGCVSQKRAPPKTRFWARWFRKGSFTPKFGKTRCRFEDAEPSDKDSGLANDDQKDTNHTADENHKTNAPVNGGGGELQDSKKDADGHNVKSSSSSTDVTVPAGEAAKADEKQAEGEAAAADKQPVRGWCAAFNWRKRYTLVSAAVAVVMLVILVLTCSVLSREALGLDDWSYPIASTECGLVEGHLEEGVFVYRGIPYALPPTGDRRWKPPQRFQNVEDCWTGTKQVHQFAPRCPQKKAANTPANTSEDCLYLNVYTPSMSRRSRRPVLVVIPGGSFMAMSEEDHFLEPAPAMARTYDAVVVTFEYRRNLLGFLALDMLSKLVRPPTSGNYGLLDQVQVLWWVRRNIGAFGGDNTKVVLFGHGAGATSAVLLATSSMSQGLIHRVWATGASVNFPNLTIAGAARDNLEVMGHADCPNVACLYKHKPEQLVKSFPITWSDDSTAELPKKGELNAPSMVVVDGVFLKDFVYELWAQEDFTRVPIVLGSNLHELVSRGTLPEAEKLEAAELTAHVRDRLGSIDPRLADRVLYLYGRNDTTPAEQLHTMISDVRVTCPLQVLTGDFLNATGHTTGPPAAHFYIVDYSPSAPMRFSMNAEPTRLSQHGLDVAAIFGKMAAALGSSPMTRDDLQFEHNMQKLFHSFVHSSVPTLGAQPLKENPFVNYISANVRSRASQHEACAAWETFDMFPEYAKKN